MKETTLLGIKVLKLGWGLRGSIFPARPQIIMENIGGWDIRAFDDDKSIPIVNRIIQLYTVAENDAASLQV